MTQFTNFTPTNISGTSLIGEVTVNINVNIPSKNVSASFSLENMQNANVSMNLDTKLPSINVNGVQNLHLMQPIVDEVIIKLGLIVDEINA